MSRQLLIISKDEDFNTPLGNPCHCSVTFTLKKCFLMFRLNHPYFSLCPFPLFLSLDTTGNSLFTSFFQPCLYISKIPNKLSALQAEQFQFSQCFLKWVVLQSLNHFNDPSLLYWGMQGWTQHSRCWVWGKDYIPWQVGIIPNAVQDTNSLVSVKDTILVHCAQLEP